MTEDVLLPQPGYWVKAAVNDKIGWGQLLHTYYPDSWVVAFPDQEYPNTLVIPTGQYVVPLTSIYEIRKEKPDASDATAQE